MAIAMTYKRASGLGVAGLLATILLACASRTILPSRDSATTLISGTTDSLVHLLTTDQSAIGEARETVISDTLAWREEWEAVTAWMRPQPPLPHVDFTRARVAMVTDANRGDIGVVRVTGMTRHEGRLVIRVTAYGPSLSPTAVAMGVPRSADIVLIPLEPGIVQFEKRVQLIPWSEWPPP
jgi:hypothetical protein